MKRTAAAILACVTIFLIAITGLASIPGVPTGTWQAGASMSTARGGATAVLLQDGSILIAGGSDGSSALDSAEFFNTDGTFSDAPPMNVARAQHVAAVLQDGRVLVAGGTTSNGGATNSAEVYDPLSGAWTPVAGGMIEARSGATSSILQDGRVLIAGGQNYGTVSQTAEVFDTNTMQFHFVGTLSAPRMALASAPLPDGRVLITGGSNGSVAWASTDIFDPIANAVSAGPMMSTARQGHSATALLDGTILIAGGNDGSQDLASAETFNAATGTFAPLASTLATARQGHRAIVLSNNNAVLIFGGSSAGQDVATAELYFPWGGTFAGTGAPTAARQQAASSGFSLDGLLLVAGGMNSSGALSSTEIYGFATVKTDAKDYAPGSIVTITGTGWQPGETVTLTLVESPLIDTPPPLTAVADANGNIFNNQFSPDVQDVGIRFYLTAVGQSSGFQAQTSFTDALKLQVTNFTISAPSGVANGTAVETNQQFSLTVTISNNNTSVGDSGVTWGSVSAALTLPGGPPTWTTNTANLTGAHLGNVTTGGTSNCTSSTTTTSCTYSWTITAPSSAISNQTFSVAISGTPSTGSCNGNNKCSDSATLKVSAVTPASLSVASGNFVAFQTGQPQTDTTVMMGQSVSVKLTVTDSGDADVNNASASALTVTPTGTVSAITCNAANPATATVAGGSNQNFNYTCSTVGSGDGTLTFSGSASGTDALSGVVVSTSTTSSNSMIVDNTEPTMGLSPTSGNYNAPFSVSWNITDPVAGGVSSGVAASTCLVKVDGNPVSTSCSGSQALSAGNHTVTASASDNAGNAGSDSRNYTVVSDNTPPVVHVTFPAPVHGQNGWYNGQDAVPVVGTVTVNDTTAVNSNVTAITCLLDGSPLAVGNQSGYGTPNASGSISVSGDGIHNVSCTGTDSAGNTGASAGSTNTATLKIDTAPPTSVAEAPSRSADHNGWFTSPVTITFNGTDATSGIANCTSTNYSGPDNAAATVSGHCTDNAGNQSSDVPFNFKYDSTPPTAVALSVTAGTSGTNGWYTSDVTVHTSGTELVSVPITCAADQFQTTETTGQVFNGSCTNDAGLSASAAPLTIKLDKTGPTATIAVTAGTLGNNGWYTSNVTISATGSDTISNPTTCTADQMQTVDTTGQIFYGSCTNDAGLRTDATALTVKRDATPPTVMITPDRSADHHGWYNHALTFTNPGTDATSGVASCTMPATYSGPDTATASVSAECTDNAGNVGHGSFSFQYDGTPPTNVAANADRVPDFNGWYNHALTVTWSGTDTTSGIDSCTTAPYSGPDNGNASLQGHCTDVAGNPSADTSFSFKYDATPPAVTATADRSADHNSWYNHALNISFNGTDSTSGIASCDSTVPYSGPDNVNASAIGHCKDNAGNQGTGTLNFKYDATPPTGVSGAPNRTADRNGWYNHAVTVQFIGTDALSGIDSCSAPSYSGPDTASASANGTCTDVAGNTSAPVASSTFQYDATPPTNVVGTASRLPDHNGWYNHALTVNFSGTDATSGIDSCTSVPYSGPDSGTASVSGTCTDKAGNVSTPPTTFGFMYDATPPVINIVAPANNATYILNAAVPSNYTCTDAASGVATCAGPVASGANFSTNPVAVHSFTVNATDQAGNTATFADNYTVQYAPMGTACYGDAGHQILQPINANGTSVFKGNSTSSAKFRVCDANGVSIGTPSVVTSFSIYQIVGGTVVPNINEDVPSTTPDTAFRWDPTAQQWIFNINNKSLQTNDTYYFSIVLNDGTNILFNYGLR